MASTDSSRQTSPVAKKGSFCKKCKICCGKAKCSFKRCFSKVNKGLPLYLIIFFSAYLVSCFLIPDSLVYGKKETIPEASVNQTEIIVEVGKTETSNTEETKQEVKEESPAEEKKEEEVKQEELKNEAKQEETKPEEPKSEEPAKEENTASEPEIETF